MNPLLVAALLAEGPAGKALAHNGLASHAQEWNREWQRAQARAWMHASPGHAALASGGETARRTVGDAAGAHPLPVFALPHVEGSMPAGTGPLRPAAPAAVIEAVRSQVPPSDTHEARASQGVVLTDRNPVGVRLPKAILAPSPMARMSPLTEVAPATAATPVRLHVERGADGLRVWIGVDGDGAAISAQAAAVIAELRRSEHLPAFRLVSVVCNGQTLYARGTWTAFPQENER